MMPSPDSDPADDDLWFLPGPPEEEPPGLAPLPHADRRALFDPRAWETAQAALAIALARLAQVFGELDARLRDAPEASRDGLRLRLALQEAADIAWWAGARFPAERLGLWVAQRIGSTAETEEAIAQAGWAVRRFTGGPAPSSGLADFLGRPRDTAVSDLSDLCASVEQLHPVTQSAILFQAWRLLAPTQDLEAVVLAARHGAGMSRLPGRGALFVPLAMSSGGALRAHGGPAERLAGWIAGAEDGVLAALLLLDRLRDWRERAEAAVTDLSGRVPGQLIGVLAAWPLVTAPLAEAETRASRAAVQRNLALLTRRGLVREVTGQGRFRIWTARI